MINTYFFPGSKFEINTKCNIHAMYMLSQSMKNSARIYFCLFSLIFFWGGGKTISRERETEREREREYDILKVVSLHVKQRILNILKKYIIVI